MQINLDEGYQFGLGVFETIAVEAGHPVLLREHLERMEHSAEVLGVEKLLKEAELYKKISMYLRKHPMEHGVLKIMLSGENLIFSHRSNPYGKERYEKGFDLGYSRVRRNETSPLVYHKTMNYGDCILEKRKAGMLGLDERIFLNTMGEISEGTTTNIFFVKNKVLYTPPVSCGLLPGVMRRHVMEHFEVEERVIYPEDVAQFEECFVTNSLMGIMPVNRLETKVFEKHTVTEAMIAQMRGRMFV